ncbi:MAG: hypothetical protein VB138_13280 [Burkholderia sp.]
MSVIAGVERGAGTAERAAWIAIGVVLLLGAHLLPALTRAAAGGLRAASVVLWIACLLATTYSHATFFLAAQRHAGEVRAMAVRDAAGPINVSVASRGRPVEVVAQDIAKAKAKLANVDAQRCAERCSFLAARRTELEARITALNVEQAEALRRQGAADAREVARIALFNREQAAEADPVTSGIATLIGIQASTADLLVALGLGLLVEAVACACWLVALNGRIASVATRSETTFIVPLGDVLTDHAERHEAAVVTGPATATGEGIDVADSRSATVLATGLTIAESAVRVEVICEDSGSIDPRLARDVARLAAAVSAGEVKPTVREIRRYFQCRQDRAMAIRRAWGERREVTEAGSQVAGPRLVHNQRVAA